MKYSYLIGMIAGDKKSQKLGRIAGIQKAPRKNSSKKKGLVEHLVIQVNRLFRKDLGVLVDSKEIERVKGNFVWLKLSKEEFKKMKQGGIELDILQGKDKDHAEWYVKWGSFIKRRDE